MLSHWQILFLSTLNQLVLRMGGQQQMFFFLPEISNALDFVSHSLLINHEIVRSPRQYNKVAELWVSKTCN